MKSNKQNHHGWRWKITDKICSYCKLRKVIQGRDNCGQPKCASRSFYKKHETSLRRIII